jgi:hypothetical protein
MILSLIAAAAVFGQVLGAPRAYTLPAPTDQSDLQLAMPNGRYGIALGAGCDGIGPGLDVVYLAGSGGVGAIQPIGTDTICNVFIDELLDPTPCLTNDAGLCDVALEES